MQLWQVSAETGFGMSVKSVTMVQATVIQYQMPAGQTDGAFIAGMESSTVVKSVMKGIKIPMTLQTHAVKTVPFLIVETGLWTMVPTSRQEESLMKPVTMVIRITPMAVQQNVDHVFNWVRWEILKSPRILIYALENITWMIMVIMV